MLLIIKPCILKLYRVFYWILVMLGFCIVVVVYLQSKLTKKKQTLNNKH
jgi:Ni/Fe-hydrogenase subunit HybB-like protein